MTKFVGWNEEESVELAGGKAAVEEAKAQLRAVEQAFKLSQARHRRNLSQREVAEAMGVTVGRVSQIENGDLRVSEVDTLARYVAALGGKLRLVADFGNETITIH